MKNNLENSIKESLENFEAPYNPNAWKAMSAKLDIVMPTSSFGSSFKWVAAASVVVVASISAYFMFKEDGITQQDTLQIADTTEQQEVKQSESKHSTSNSNVNQTEGSTEQSDNLNVEYNNDNGTVIIIDENSGNQLNPDSSDQNTISEEKNNTDSNNDVTNNSRTEIIPAKINMPNISSLCSGESISIKNSNSINLEVAGPGLNKIIKANSTLTVELKNVGTYTISNNVNTSTSLFNVKSLPKVDFIIDYDNKFEDGLPTTKLTSTSGSNLTWSVNNFPYKGSEIDIHMYNRGVQNITLTSKGTNGCENSVHKQIFNETKYNLMAVNSFIPNDNDPRLNTFMPYALTQRNTNFTLIIIDPTDGHNVYQTNDSSQGWDGTDMRTGQQVKYESTYIWKVIIDTPERGENNEYAGNIIPITK